MKAEIITVGDELLIGQVLDTNSGWIANRLNDTGLRVTKRLSTGDEKEEIACAVSEALDDADVVIMTGGLGPTKDDITKQTLAMMFGCGMKEDADTQERNRKLILARGFDFNELNRSQALVPECCMVLPNNYGTAPGLWFERDEHVLIALPGVPFEMKKLMDEEVLPRLRNHFKLSEITHKTMITAGIAESMLAERIAPWEDALPEYLHLAYLPSPSGVRLRLSAYEHAGAREEIDLRFSVLEEVLGVHVVGYGDATLQSAVAQMLTDRGEALALAESCTGGTIASMFTQMPGASAYFRCAAVAYSNQCKIKMLGVDADVLEREGAVSQSVAEQMAIGMHCVSGADYAIATTGIAGPGGGSEYKPLGTVWIAIAHHGGIESQMFTFGNLRAVNIERASSSAIDMLRKILMKRSKS